MNPQDILLKEVRSKLQPSASINDALAIALQISYDAAHRRVSGKSKFSIEETIIICNYFSISMDNLFRNKKNVIVEKTKKIETIQDFKDYFEKTNQVLSALHPKDTIVYYSAKDIPMNYSVTGTVFSKFKFYIWFLLLNKEQTISFEKFGFEESVLSQNDYLKTFFEDAKRIEIWNDTTINSSLQQMNYFFEAGLLNYKNALHILEDIASIIETLEKKCESDNQNFQLYYNELLILNNSVLFSSKEKSAFFLPYNVLGYYVTLDKKTCEEQQEYITNQLLNSKSLNQCGKKDRKIFFHKMYQKIAFYKSKIENTVLN